MTKRRGHGEGSVFKRADGLWVGRVELEPTADGTRRRSVFYGRTRREALNKVDKARGELRDGQEPTTATAARTTVGEILDEWLDALERPGAKQRPLTRVRYESVAETHVRPYLGRLRIRRLDGDRVADWQDQLLEAGCAPRSVWKARTVLAAVIRLARRKRPPLLRENPLELVDPPSAAKPDKRALSADEARKFLLAIRGHRLETLVLALLMLGVRRGEILGLAWADVDLVARTAAIRQEVLRVPGERTLQIAEPKSAAGVRVLPLPSLLLERLRALPRESELVFPSSTGTPMEPRNFNRAFAALIKDAGIDPLTPHELRHSASTILQVLKVPPLVVAQLLGHADPAVTLRSYGHIVPSAHRDAMDVMDGYIRSLSN